MIFFSNTEFCFIPTGPKSQILEHQRSWSKAFLVRSWKEKGLYRLCDWKHKIPVHRPPAGDCWLGWWCDDYEVGRNCRNHYSRPIRVCCAVRVFIFANFVVATARMVSRLGRFNPTPLLSLKLSCSKLNKQRHERVFESIFIWKDTAERAALANGDCYWVISNVHAIDQTHWRLLPIAKLLQVQVVATSWQVTVVRSNSVVASRLLWHSSRVRCVDRHFICFEKKRHFLLP